jgi:hypothetical protein
MISYLVEKKVPFVGLIVFLAFLLSMHKLV